MFDIQEIQKNAKLAALEYFDSISSTSDRASELANAGWNYPGLVLAAKQTSGRGQGSNVWWSSDRSLTFSWLSNLSKSNIQFIPMLAAVATGDAIEAQPQLSKVSVQFKWPNDLLLHNRKFGGILSEFKNGVCIVGIGLNVNQETAPPVKDTKLSPTSLRVETGIQTDKQKLLIAILQNLKTYVDALNDFPSQTSDRIDSFNSRLQFLDDWVEFQTPDGRQVRGICTGLNKRAGLVIKDGDDLKEFFSGTMRAV